MTAGELDEDSPHDLRRDSKEMNTIPPLDSMDIDQPQISLVHQGGGLERMARPLARHHTFGEPMQLFVHERHELLERGLIALAPG
jgi:hypothetical protein